MLFPYGHCPNCFRPPNLCQIGKHVKKCSNHLGKPLHPPGKSGQKSAPNRPDKRLHSSTPPPKKKEKEKGGFFYLRVHPDIEVNITWHLKNIPRHDEVDVFSTSCSYSDNGAFTECELSFCPLKLKILLRGDTFQESQPDYRDDGVVFENQRGVNDKDILEKKSQLQQIMMEHLYVLKHNLPQVGLILQINLAWTTDNLLVGRPRPARVTEKAHLRLEIHKNCFLLHRVSLVWHSEAAKHVFWGDTDDGAVQNWLQGNFHLDNLQFFKLPSHFQTVTGPLLGRIKLCMDVKSLYWNCPTEQCIQHLKINYKTIICKEIEQNN